MSTPLAVALRSGYRAFAEPMRFRLARRRGQTHESEKRGGNEKDGQSERSPSCKPGWPSVPKIEMNQAIAMQP